MSDSVAHTLFHAICVLVCAILVIVINIVHTLLCVFPFPPIETSLGELSHNERRFLCQRAFSGPLDIARVAIFLTNLRQYCFICAVLGLSSGI
jgi:hypothetical protein